MNDDTRHVRSILAALASSEEYESLRRILGDTDWTLCFAQAFSDAETALRASPVGVVICARRFADGHSWKDVLAEIQRMPNPPQLIVADQLADEVLWAEVLNLGCYDLLMTPFEAEEVLRVVPMAWVSWKHEQERAAARRKAPKSIEPGWQSARGFLAAGAG